MNRWLLEHDNEGVLVGTRKGGAARGRFAAVEDIRDVGVVHEDQGLPLGLEG